MLEIGEHRIVIEIDILVVWRPLLSPSEGDGKYRACIANFDLSTV